jgi:hypothetical protein
MYKNIYNTHINLGFLGRINIVKDTYKVRDRGCNALRFPGHHNREDKFSACIDQQESIMKRVSVLNNFQLISLRNTGR